ncbi:hypothetical protein ACQY0O_006907 [Thecaphora frezii]
MRRSDATSIAVSPRLLPSRLASCRLSPPLSDIPLGFAKMSSRFYTPLHNFHPHQPAFKHRWGAKLLGATMWFWIFYRAKQDGPVLLGLRHPWDGHGHHDEGHDGHH